ncbi:methylmalonyl Co-A mutase-associated GTPase MeaB [bacterium]|nr:methylmalonyl Co-A mutase-associated GTPase MeaB [bacterium]
MNRQALPQLLEAAFGGNRRALARLISLVENDAPERSAILDAVIPKTGGAWRVGVTGPPGAGKSSLLEEIVMAYRERGKTVGLAAVDPTSPFTGGAFLRDRIRMARAGADPEVFIRSLGSRGSLGGLSAQTEAVLDLFDAAGKDMVFVETLGVGQAELDVAECGYTTVVVLVPESGDGIQAMKAGLMEIGDIFLVNKCDHDGAALLEMELRAALELGSNADSWKPPVIQTSAIEGRGIAEAVEAIEAHRTHLAQNGQLPHLRRRLLERRLRRGVETRVTHALWTDPERAAKLEETLDKLLSGGVGFEESLRALLPEGLDGEES